MKKLIGLIVIITAVFLVQYNALAADKPLKVGVLNLQKCIKESDEGKRIYKDLKKRHGAMQKELDKKQKALLDMQKEMEKQSLMLSLDAKENKQKEFEKNKRDLGYLLQDLNEDMKKAEAEAQQKILKSLEGVVEKIAARGKYDLILERISGGVLFTSDVLDITDEVTKELNKVKH